MRYWYKLSFEKSNSVFTVMLPELASILKAFPYKAVAWNKQHKNHRKKYIYDIQLLFIYPWRWRHIVKWFYWMLNELLCDQFEYWMHLEWFYYFALSYPCFTLWTFYRRLSIFKITLSGFLDFRTLSFERPRCTIVYNLCEGDKTIPFNISRQRTYRIETKAHHKRFKKKPIDHELSIITCNFV